MSQGTVIGIAVGVVGGLLFLLAAGLVYWYIRRSRRQQAEGSRRPGSLLQSGTLSAGPASETGEPKFQDQTLNESHPAMQQTHGVYEVDGRLFRIEMANDNGRFEMDASGHGSAELDTAAKGEPSITTETTAVSPVSPPLPDSHEFPPPEYTAAKRTQWGQ